jgi:hypothetical protein
MLSTLKQVNKGRPNQYPVGPWLVHSLISGV